MRVFLWDLTSPERDGALENDIIVHENTHGISNRMTGGGTGRWETSSFGSFEGMVNMYSWACQLSPDERGDRDGRRLV